MPVPTADRRALRLPAPAHHVVRVADGTCLRLTRYRGGDLGPVLVLGGMACSSQVFLLPGLATNLTEHLVAAGHDVWLLDARYSPDLASRNPAYTLDDIAADFGPVVAEVRRHADGREVQLLGHCYGAITMLMALLGGLEGVRSVVALQGSLTPAFNALTRLKAHAGLATLLKAAGLQAMAVSAGDRPAPGEWLTTRVIEAVQPQVACREEACQRAHFIYGEVWLHAHLDETTHATIPEWFGETTTTMAEHMAAHARAGKVVAADGADRYMPHLDRLALPISFLHGELNSLMGQAGTERTARLLADRNGDAWYRVVTLPGYGHLDPVIGRDAARDVYPAIVAELAWGAAFGS